MDDITESYRGMQLAHCNAVCLFASWLFFFGMRCLGWRGPGARYPALSGSFEAQDVSRSAELRLEWQLYFSMATLFPPEVLDALRGYGVYSYDYAADRADQVSGLDVLQLVETFHDEMVLTHSLARLMVDTAYTYLVSFVGGVDCPLVNEVLQDSSAFLCIAKQPLIAEMYAKYPDPALARMFSLCRRAPALYAFSPYYVEPDRRYLGADQDQTLFLLEEETPEDDFLFYDSDDDNYLTQENYNDADLEF